MCRILSLNMLMLVYSNTVLLHLYYICISFLLHFEFLFDFCSFTWYTGSKGGNLMENLNSNITDDIEVTEMIETDNNPELEPDTDASNSSTDLIEYKELDEPCVALTIIGENRLTDAEVFVRRGFKFSIKAFFSTIMLTIMNMFI